MQMNNEVMQRQIEEIDAELDAVARRCHELQELMQQQLFYNTRAGDRRQLVSEEQWADRRQGERREPHRAGPGRRAQTDRRTPLELRWPELGDQLSQLTKQSALLLDQKRLREIGVL